MKTGTLYTTEYDGKKYEFFPSRQARAAIQEMQLDAMENLSDASAFTTMMELQGIKTEIEKAKKEGDEAKEKKLNEKLASVSMQAMSSIKDITKTQNKSDDEYEIAKILLMNTKPINGEVSNDLAEEILEHMEYELGADKFQEALLGIYDKVFTMIAEVQDHKKEMQKRLNEKAEPMLLS